MKLGEIVVLWFLVSLLVFGWAAEQGVNRGVAMDQERADAYAESLHEFVQADPQMAMATFLYVAWFGARYLILWLVALLGLVEFVRWMNRRRRSRSRVQPSTAAPKGDSP